MKKTFYFLGILGLLSILPTYAYQTLSSVEVFRYSQKSFVLSDNFTSYESCVSTKKENDLQYSNYKRSECFSDGKGFKYFICDGTTNCTLTKEASPNEVNQVKTTEAQATTTTTSIISAKNKSQLDTYLQKLEKQKSKYKNVEDYLKQLEKTSSQLGKLSVKYEKNPQVKAMLEYLDQGVKKIITTTKISTEPKDDVAQLLCELEENCEEKQVVIDDGKLEPLPPPTPVVRPGKIQTGTTTTPTPTSPTTPPVVGGDSPIVQGMYRLTTKKYVGNFRQHGDVCSKEFGTEWRVADKSRDAFLMAAKNETVWDTLPKAYCEGYSTIASNHFGGTYSFANGKEVTNFWIGCGGPQYKVVCEKTGTTTTPTTPVSPYIEEENPLIPVTHPEMEAYFQNLKNELASKVREDNNFYYINDSISLSKNTFDGFELYSKTDQICPSGYSLGGNISLYNQEALGYFFTKNPDAFPYTYINPNGVNHLNRYYTFWTKQDKWTDNFMMKNSKERALSINSGMLFDHMGVNMVDYAKSWNNEKDGNGEYYLYNINSLGEYTYTTKKHVVCTNNSPKDNKFLNIITLENQINSPGYFANGANGSLLGSYYNMTVLRKFVSNELALYDFFMPVLKEGNSRWYYYQKEKQ